MVHRDDRRLVPRRNRRSALRGPTQLLRYDLDLTELFAIQNEIAEPVAGAIEPELLKTEGAQAAAWHVRLQMAWDNLKSFGNIRQPPPERARYRIAFKTSRKSVRAGRPLLAGARQERLNPGPLLVGQIRRVALGLLLNFGHPATRRWGPHHKLESRPNLPFNGFSSGL